MSIDLMSDFEGGSSWKLLFARWKLACAIAILCFATSVFCISRLTPLYKADVQFLLPINPVEDPSDRKGFVQIPTDMFVVRSYSEIVRDPGICEKIISQMHLAESPEFRSRPSAVSLALAWLAGFMNDSKPVANPVRDADAARDLLLQKYRDRLKAVNDNKSLILDLSFEATDPYLATRIVNAQADQFIAAEVEYRRREIEAKTKWMQVELNRSAEEVRAAQIAIQLHASSPIVSRDVAANQMSDFKFREMMAQSKMAAYESLLVKYQTTLAEQHYAGSDIRILSPASVPSRPSFPRKLLFSAAAAGVSIVAGFGTALIATVLRRKQTLEEIAAGQGLMVVGRLNIPRQRWVDRLGWGGRLRRAFFWEQVREIRSAIRMPDRGGTVIAVVSALPQEGKSVIAAALARSIACSGTQTLLLDANLRSPSFYSPANSSLSLKSYFEGEASAMQSSALVDPSMPLYVLCCPKEDRLVNVDALSSVKMRMLVDELRSSFGAIIIDTPAMSIVSDAFSVAALADEVLLTATADQTSYEKFTVAIANLRRRCVLIKGLIITDRRRPARASYARLSSYITRERIRDVWPIVN